MTGAQVPYDPVQTESSTGNLGGGFSVRSTPADMGAQVGQAVEKAGEEGFSFAQKEQGIINETAMTSADADFATKVGKLKGDYMSLTGMEAYNAFPSYQEAVKGVFQETRGTLPAGAQHGFDMMAARSMANHVADGSSYAASQLKEANRDSYASVANVNLQALLDPQTAASKERSDYHLDTIKFATAAQIHDDAAGLKTNPETGEVSFDESTNEGRLAKAQFQQQLETNLSQGYVNKYTTLAKQDVFGAYDQYKEDRDKMPKAAQVALDSSFAPKIFDEHKKIATGSTLVAAQQDHYQKLTDPSSGLVSTIMKNELPASGAIAVHSDGDGRAIGGINSEAYPKQFSEAKNILETKGQESAKQYINDFYQKDIIDKNNVKLLPADVQDVVADGLVNHWSGFQNQLLSAARSGASRSELIQMRRNEYERLALSNPEKYAGNFAGWNNRLDSLQASTEGKKTYATNENGGPLTLADYYRTNSQEVLRKGDEYAERQMPGDLALKRLVRQNLSNEMSKTISNETQQHLMDNRNILKTIQDTSPQTEDDLRAQPGMSDLLDNIAIRDPKFSETIPTLIAKSARRNEVTNSANAYDTVLRTLEPNDQDHPNRIASQDHLAKLLSRSDGTGINMKDYNDAKEAIEISPTIKDKLVSTMKNIESANGNIDGKGKDRALQWYNQTMAAYKQQKTADGDKFSDSDFAQSIGAKQGPPLPTPPSRMQQISNWASSLTKTKESVPTFDSPDNAEFLKLPSGAQFMVAGEKTPRTKK